MSNGRVSNPGARFDSSSPPHFASVSGRPSELDDGPATFCFFWGGIFFSFFSFFLSLATVEPPAVPRRVLRANRGVGDACSRENDGWNPLKMRRGC